MTQQPPRHPLEDMPNMAERVTLPASGIEVVVRRADVDALSQDALRQGLGISGIDQLALGDTAQLAASVGAMQALDLVQTVEAFIFRSVIAAPPLDELAARYGGNVNLPDFGMGSDYRFLQGVVDRLNPPAEDAAEQKGPPKSKARKTK